MSSLPLMRTGWGGEQLTRGPFHGFPISVFIKLIVNGGEDIFEFLLSLAFGDEPLLLEGKRDLGGIAETKV